MFGGIEKFQTDPHWHDLIPFHEYFHGDNGAGIGASHQTGWTGTVALLFLLGGGLHGLPAAGPAAEHLAMRLPARSDRLRAQGISYAWGDGGARGPSAGSHAIIRNDLVEVALKEAT